MVKPLWGLAGVALLGTAGLVGAVIVASSGNEEEVVQQVETASPNPSPTVAASTPADSPTPGETITYSDPTYGYSFEYPASWEISSEPDPGSVTLYSYDLEGVRPEEAGRPVPLDKLKVRFWIAEGVDKPLEEWLADGDNSPGQISPPIVVAAEEATIGDRAALRRVTDEGDGTRHVNHYVPLEGGRIFVINAVPADSERLPQFESILASVRF